MELRTLKYFIVVAEELNITKAAKKLMMSQPPLSAQMKNLEDELSCTLFIRGKRSLKLTDSGQLLYRRAKEIVALSEKASSEIESINNGIQGTIALGLVEGMAPNIAADWISGFMKIYPNVTFKIYDDNSDNLTEKIRSGIISLAVITSPYDQLILNSFKVGEEKLVAFMSKNNPIATKEGKSISVSQLANEKLIVPSRKATIAQINKWFRQLSISPKIVCEMDSYLDASALAVKDVGISIFPRTEYVLNDSIISKEIEGVSNNKEEYLFVWRKGHPLPVIEEAFIDFVKNKVMKTSE